jgi:signal transduction histidine kinase/CheY-like chemotaxis protein
VLDTRLPMQNKRLLLCQAHDGKERLVLESAAPLLDNASQFCGAILILRDISDTIDQMRVADKMESFKTLAGGLANDFNNLLTVITNSLFMARLDLKTDSDKYRILTGAEQAAFQATILTNQLLSIARDGRPVLTDIDLRQVISSLAGFVVNNDAVDYDISFADELAMVSADRGMIDQAIGHVLKNAVQAIPDGGEIKVRAENVTVGPGMALPLSVGEYVRVSISDSGKGIPRENKAKVFDPFFTTKPDGHGLGLSLAYSAIRQHSGHVSVESGANGTTVSLYLPAIKRTGSEKPVKGSGRGRILFMDDEELLRKSAERILSYLGYEVETASNGNEAVAAYSKAMAAGTGYDLVILDLMVDGGRGGKDIIGELIAADPDARVVISSGYVNDPVVTDFEQYGFCGAITKPYNISEMSATLAQLMEKKKS